MGKEAYREGQSQGEPSAGITYWAASKDSCSCVQRRSACCRVLYNSKTKLEITQGTTNRTGQIFPGIMEVKMNHYSST